MSVSGDFTFKDFTMGITIGCHLSAANGFLAMGKTAAKIGANTFAFFTRNPQGGKDNENRTVKPRQLP